MLMRRFLTGIWMTCVLFIYHDAAGQREADTSFVISEQYLQRLESVAHSTTKKLDKESAKALKKLKQYELRMAAKMKKLDSSAAKQMLENITARYQYFENKLKPERLMNGRLQQYIPRLDSLSTSLHFLDEHKELLADAKNAAGQLKDAMAKMEELKMQLQKAGNVEQFLKERRQFLKEQLSRVGLAKHLKKLNKQVYYYSQQVQEYRNILNDPKKIEKKALELLSRTKLFKDFMRRNSMLASLFGLPQTPSEGGGLNNLAGLQTRVQVNTLVQQQIAAGGPGAADQFRQNMQAAQSQLNQLKDKVLKAGGSSSNAELPEGFKLNNQKTKSFLQRLELGTNVQTQKASNFFPVTSDIGLSLGYKLNDKSVIGVGASYKLGWGSGLDRIKLSHEGAGLRSYVDIKLKGSFWISGGYEQNYRASPPALLRGERGVWYESGLIGISKVISLKSKVFKKTSVKLLWDFMSYQQVPRTQAILMRVGYGF